MFTFTLQHSTMQKAETEKQARLLDAIGIRLVNEDEPRTVATISILKYRDKLGDDVITPFIPDRESFTPMKKIQRGDWMAEHKEAGQTYKQFLRGQSRQPSLGKNTIYLLPITFKEDPVPIEVLTLLAQYASTFFGMPVKVLKPRKMIGKVRDRLNQGIYQVHATDILDKIDKIPRDAFCTAAITMCDLYPRDSWNFVFGLARSGGGQGVYSLARYLSNFGDNSTTQIDLDRDSIPSILIRACKTMCHEIGHMFGMKHCVFYQCLMNGSNHLEESDSRPNFLCPVCLRKLQFACKFDITERYREMDKFWTEQKVDIQSDWVKERLQILSTK